MSFSPTLFAGSRFAVLGLGRAGLPAATALRDMGAQVFVWDDRATADGFDNRLPSDVPGHLDALVLSPGIAHALPTAHPQAAWARRAGVPILTDAELLFQALPLRRTFRRHHRHQRQIHHHRAAGAYAGRCRRARRRRRQSGAGGVEPSLVAG
jgi:hypothetical protein